jgi:hypothetical protein
MTWEVSSKGLAPEIDVCILAVTALGRNPTLNCMHWITLREEQHPCRRGRSLAMRSLLIACASYFTFGAPTTLSASEEPSKLHREFADPPQRYWPRPLWFWNNTAITIQTVKAQMQLARDRSRYGGFGILPFGKSFSPAYLSEEYFAVYRAALEQARTLGLTLLPNLITM